MQQRLDTHVPKPFVKWAGGKRQLLPLLTEMFPAGYGAYHEPFVGGGAVLFNILASGRSTVCHASDLNSDLILTYVTIRDRVEDLIESLKSHDAAFREDSKRYYYAVRAQRPRSQVEKASRLIFLNRTCFNGLYRVNSRGMFNVPMGSYTNPKILDGDNLHAVSAALREGGVTFECSDFDSVLKRAESGDLVYFDPPYHPVNNGGNFTGYTSGSFTHADLKRLATVCRKLDETGCRVVLSNSSASEVTSLFKDEPWSIRGITAARSINSDGQNRTGHREVIVTNYGGPAAREVSSARTVASKRTDRRRSERKAVTSRRQVAKGQEIWSAPQTLA